eukprot:431137-Rhodomonas_salina.2
MPSRTTSSGFDAEACEMHSWQCDPQRSAPDMACVCLAERLSTWNASHRPRYEHGTANGRSNS